MRALITLFALLILYALVGCGSGSSSDSSLPSLRLYGIDFSPYLDGQDPRKNVQISADQLQTRMQLIAPDTQWIRTYSCRNGLERVGAIAHSLRLKAAIGAALGPDMAINEQEIANLIALAQRGEADLLVVGNEVLLNQDITKNLAPDKLIDYITRVRKAVPGIPVTTADTPEALLANSKVMDACDNIFVNYHPFNSNTPIDQVITKLDDWHSKMKPEAIKRNKEVIVSETGWPSDSSAPGGSPTSPETASRYLREFLAWANKNNVQFFYFEAFDEKWKETPDRPEDSHWGMRDSAGTLKKGEGDGFKIQITYWPPYGTLGFLQGKIGGFEPARYRVVVYIQSNSHWYIKPYLNSPLTNIEKDGTWTCDIGSGGPSSGDPQAIRIVAYLVPRDYSPPLNVNEPNLPPSLEQNALAKAEITRPPTLGPPRPPFPL
jgi:exo-beta-1,3-glucanase (GH17 family)